MERLGRVILVLHKNLTVPTYSLGFIEREG